MDRGWDIDAAMEAATCAYYLDIIGVLVPLLLGIVLITAAWRYLQSDRLSTVATMLAVPVGLVVGAYPAYIVWWLIDYYGLRIGPTEVVLIALAAAILASAAYSGWRTAAFLIGRQTPRAT